MTLWEPSEEDSGLVYLIGAGVCWLSPLWFELFSTAVIEPLLLQWSLFGLFLL